MLNKLVAFSLSQRLLVALLTVLLIGAGMQSFRQLPIDAFPDVSTTQVKLILKAPGMTPEEVETRIVAPIEAEMLGIPNEHILRAVAKYGLADITIDFAEGTDIYWARSQVAERYNNILGSLPAGISGGLAPITTPLGEMFMFTVEGGGLSLQEKRSLLDWVIRPQLRTLPGVADVNTLGGLVRTFEVTPDSAALAARGLQLSSLEQALARNNRNDGAGRINSGEETLVVRVQGAIRTLDDVRNIVVANVQGVPVRVGEVATVELGSLTRYGAVTRDGHEETAEGLVLGLRGANARQVVAEVQAKLAEIQHTLPPGVKLVTFYNRGALVERAVGTVSKALAEAIVLVLVLLVLFLGHLRAAVVVAASLPLAALVTFLFMRQFGLSANLMSLGGLAIAIGMLVDGAVVVVENIVTHLAHDRGARELPKLHVIYRSVLEVIVPVVSGVLIIIVFMPLLTLQGLEGKLFVPVALTIVFALAGSLLLSLTVIPVLASWLLKAGAHEDPWLVRKAHALYAPMLDWALGHGKWVGMGAIAMLLGAAATYPFIGKAFMPALDEGDVILQMEKLPSISLDQSIATDLRVERAILQHVPEVQHIIARSGSDELGLDPMGLNQTDAFLVLKPMSEWRVKDKAWVIDQIRQVMRNFPGIAINFTQPIDMRVSEMLTGVRGDLAVKIFGPDLHTLNRLAQEVQAQLVRISGAQDVLTVKNDGVQYLQVRVDRLAAGRFGLNAEDVQSDLRTMVEGNTLGVVVEGVRRTPLVLRGGADVRNDPQRFADLRLATPGGTPIPLGEVAHLQYAEGPVKIERENASRFAVVQANVRGRDLVGFVDEAKRQVGQAVKLPPGYRIEWGGQFENQQRAAQRLAIVVPVALGLVFLLLFATFRSMRQAVLVLANIPFALVGGVFGLALTGEFLSVPASVGFIALLGIAVLNGVVMVSYFNQLHREGLAPDEAVREGARRRLRPVLMTASITAFGLIPLLLASGPGSEIQKPLAVVVVGGLITSTILTLGVLPVLYRRFGFAAKE